MGQRNISRLWTESLVAAEPLDLTSGETAKILPKTDDTGAINIGDGSTDLDFKIFLGSTAEYVLFDVGNSQVTVTGVPLISNSTINCASLNLTGAFSANTVSLTGALTPSGTGLVGHKTLSTDSASITINTTHLGGIVKLTKSDGAQTVEMPAANSITTDSFLILVSEADQAHVVNSASATLIAPGNVAANTITLNAASKIGQALTLVSDGERWVMTAGTPTAEEANFAIA